MKNIASTLVRGAVLTGLTLSLFVFASAQEKRGKATTVAPDRAAIRAACLDYIHGFYQAKPELLDRSVSKDLVKFGHYRAQGTSEYRGMAMSFAQAKALAKTWNAKGWLPKDCPKSVVILDQLDKTAAAKVTAYRGSDYMQLEKVDGRWMIRHILWQSKPMAATEKRSKKGSDGDGR